MNVVPLAADSLGVRSMATYVECGATRILIDPGATLAPNRYGLPPADWARTGLVPGTTPGSGPGFERSDHAGNSG